jgi:RimJ/RimL family protein N-acetyltransferase
VPVVLFPTKPLLHGEKVLLRPFTAADIDAMGPVLADPEVLRLTGSVHSSAERPAPELDERTRAWYETREAQIDRLDLAVVDLATGECVGEVVLNDWQPENQACNFRVLIGPRGRDRGLGSEATRLVLDHAFAATDLYRIELGVYAFNPRAQHVYARAGFLVEGRRRAAFRFDGERVDEIIMAVLRDDWLRRQGPPR